MSGVVLVAVAIGLAVSDVALAKWAPEHTYSRVIRKASRNPVIPFAFGVLAGHLFWPL